MKQKDTPNAEVIKLLKRLEDKFDRRLNRIELSVSQPEVIEELVARAKRDEDDAIMRLAEKL